MTEEIKQIADDLERVGKAMAGLDPVDPEHVRVRLEDFSTVLSVLRERVLALDNQQPLTAADAPQEKQNEN